MQRETGLVFVRLCLVHRRAPGRHAMCARLKSRRLPVGTIRGVEVMVQKERSLSSLMMVDGRVLGGERCDSSFFGSARNHVYLDLYQLPNAKPPNPMGFRSVAALYAVITRCLILSDWTNACVPNRPFSSTVE
jgi:hypothetical protein